MGKKSRVKGAVGEREVVNLLLKWLPPGWTARRLRARDQSDEGDVYLRGPAGEVPAFCVEVKRVASFSIDSLMRAGGSALFDSWWRQACRQAEAGGRRPMLLFKQDRGVWLCAVSYTAGVVPGVVPMLVVRPGVFVVPLRCVLEIPAGEWL